MQEMIYDEIKSISKYQQFLNSLPDGMAIIGQREEIIFANKALH